MARWGSYKDYHDLTRLRRRSTFFEVLDSQYPMIFEGVMRVRSPGRVLQKEYHGSCNSFQNLRSIS